MRTALAVLVSLCLALSPTTAAKRKKSQQPEEPKMKDVRLPAEKPELNPKDPWAACMLTDAVPARETAARRALLGVPQHCSASHVANGLEACQGPHAVTAKQRNQIQLMARLTMAPEPPADEMTHDEANAWLSDRFLEWKAQGGPMR